MNLISNIWSGLTAFVLSQKTINTSREKVVFAIISGVFLFLFLLFFQPFGVNNYDPNERITSTFFLLMLLMGGTVSLLILLSEFLIFPLFVKLGMGPNRTIWIIWSCFWLGNGMFFLYNYLGDWHDLHWKSYLEFLGNVSVLGILPLAGFFLYEQFNTLNKKLDDSKEQDKERNKNEDHLIVIQEENGKNHFSIPLKYLIYLKAADNYIEIYHLHGQELTKSLVRSSLKNLEEKELSPQLIRCHRSFMINLMHLAQVSGNKNKSSLTLDHVLNPIPVSRQYHDSIYRLVNR